MPCYEPSYDYSRGDAILCSIFHSAEKTGQLTLLINTLDYDLIGLSKKQVKEWWKHHKNLDKQKLKEKH